MKDTVSVVVPVYNNRSTIERAIRSILQQTRPVEEIIVVDDASTDDSAAFVQKQFGRDIILIHHPTMRGAQVARNTGIRAAQGEWIAFLDGDDVWLERKIEWQLQAARQVPEAGVIHGDILRVRGDNGTPRPLHLPKLSGKIAQAVLKRPGPMFQCMMVKKTLLEDIGYLDEGIEAYQEWDASICLAMRTLFYFIHEPLAIYYAQRPHSISMDKARVFRGYQSVVQKHEQAIRAIAGPLALACHYMVLSDLAKGIHPKQITNGYFRKAIATHPASFAYWCLRRLYHWCVPEQ